LLSRARAGLAGRAASVVSGAGELDSAVRLRAETGRVDHPPVVAVPSHDGWVFSI